eukprot:708527-Prymnesium_polylepis.1
MAAASTLAMATGALNIPGREPWPPSVRAGVSTSSERNAPRSADWKARSTAVARTAARVPSGSSSSGLSSAPTARGIANTRSSALAAPSSSASAALTGGAGVRPISRRLHGRSASGFGGFGAIQLRPKKSAGLGWLGSCSSTGSLSPGSPSGATTTPVRPLSSGFAARPTRRTSLPTSRSTSAASGAAAAARWRRSRRTGSSSASAWWESAAI